MEQKKTVIFNKSCNGYIKGDVCGINAEVADKLASQGLVSILGEDKQPSVAVLDNLPKQEKISNLCAICGEVFDTDEALQSHKKEVHNI